jgi:aspartyl-tRNA(Asn)/glutamyl-tRNA(Gln) amidotransferase subunit C
MINEEEFIKLTQLCRISCTEEEKANFLQSLSQILDYVDLLNDVDTGATPACNTVLETLDTVVRDDTPEEALSRDLFLANAPAHTGGMVRVPPVLKGD